MTIEAFNQYLQQNDQNAAILRHLQDKVVANHADDVDPWDYPDQWSA